MKDGENGLVVFGVDADSIIFALDMPLFFFKRTGDLNKGFCGFIGIFDGVTDDILK